MTAHTHFVVPLVAIASVLAAPPLGAAAKSPRIAFPAARPVGGSFMRPYEAETLAVSPPGFCWWRAGKDAEIRYRLEIVDAAGTTVYTSPPLADPVHVPDRVLPAGAYTWTVRALGRDGAPAAVQGTRTFAIAPDAFAQPWVDPAALLARVPREHPRLLFPRAQLEAVKATLGTTRKEAFESLSRAARGALRLTPPPEPDYDKLTDAAERRMAYQRAYGELRRYHTEGAVALALMYLLTGERQHGDVAKAILLGAAKWNPEGISSIMAPYGDEVGLGLVKAGAQCYDWLYDCMTEAERAEVKAMLLARGDQMLRRLQRRDYLCFPEESHAGRLPGYLIEHAIALAEEPRAAVWLRYALECAMTVFPHWAGYDGGWAEGVKYGVSYNTMYVTPLESLRAATGLDLWRRPVFGRVRDFFLYTIAPRGEIAPFGDTEDGGFRGNAGGVRALMLFHALRYRDGAARGWVELFDDGTERRQGLAYLPGIILPDDVAPVSPASLPPDAVFYGVGWAALHGDLAHPDRDLHVLFKSSPYGAVSHGHADQNSFAVMKGGTALAIPAGVRYPTHGSPFHVKYTQQTIAHNAILVDGRGQINRDGAKGGRLTAFVSHSHMACVSGDAAACYGGALTRCMRHVLLVRPGLLVVVDDLEAKTPASFQWLLHAREKLALDEAAQAFVSRREGKAMAVRLFTAGGFAFSQTDAWPVAPKEGYPKLGEKEPAPQWHFTASARVPATGRRIAAVMWIGEEKEAPAYTLSQSTPDSIAIDVAALNASVRVALDPAAPGPVLSARCEAQPGAVEALTAR